MLKETNDDGRLYYEIKVSNKEILFDYTGKLFNFSKSDNKAKD